MCGTQKIQIGLVRVGNEFGELVAQLLRQRLLMSGNYAKLRCAEINQSGIDGIQAGAGHQAYIKLVAHAAVVVTR